MDYIRKRIQDKISLDIYDARLHLLYTNDEQRYMKIISELPGRREWFARLTNGIRSDRYSLFGAGGDGKLLLQFIEYYFDNKPLHIYDNNRSLWGTYLGGILVSSPEEIHNDNELIIVVSTKFSQEIVRQLHIMGIEEKRILTINNEILYEWNKKQYFDLFSPCDNEIFIDAGAYDASSSINFALWSHDSYEKIFAFEAVKEFAEISRRNFAKNNLNGIVVEKGIWSKTAVLDFNNTGGQGAHIVEADRMQSNGSVEVVSLDDYFATQEVTFIKMDIEGSELEALKGSEKLILRDKPRLAISIYHKRKDIVEIPQYLLRIVPEYKLYLRTYGFGVRDDTVLYASM